MTNDKCKRVFESLSNPARRTLDWLGRFRPTHSGDTLRGQMLRINPDEDGCEILDEMDLRMIAAHLIEVADAMPLAVTQHDWPPTIGDPQPRLPSPDLC